MLKHRYKLFPIEDLAADKGLHVSRFPTPVVIVTGAAGSIGVATVRHFHRAGATVIATDVTSAPLDSLSASLGERGLPVCAAVRPP